MIGTQMVLTVRDVPAMDFINAFAQHLKKTEKITIPKVGTRATGSNLDSGPCS